jgi:uncharacterized lipoprotein YddW (UPF0748 family)
MRLKKIKKLILWILTVAIALVGFKFFLPLPSHLSNKNKQIQGIWLTHVGNSLLVYSTQLDNVFHHLSSLNFNRVYVDVYNGGTTYPSKYAPRNKLASLPFSDPLQAAIKEGKRQGLKIYAWYEHGMMLFPNDKFAQKHPDWLLINAKGKKIIDGHLWLNPEYLEVQKYFVNLFTEVAKNYPSLYGIQLDDHWGIPIEFGDKTQAMTELTNQIVEAIHQVKQDLVVSLSPNPLPFATNRYGQNWLLWIKQGLINEVIVQIYRETSEELIATLNNSGLVEASNYVPVAIGIHTGNLQKLKSLTEIKKQKEIANKYGYGYSLFCWEYVFSPLRTSNHWISQESWLFSFLYRVFKIFF